MKLIMTLFFISLSTLAITPLDMELGYWEYKTDMSSNPMMKQAMASIESLPKAQKEMVMKKMGLVGDAQTFRKCFTKEDTKNWEKKMNEEQEKDGCKIIVKKSTKTVYEAVRECEKKAEGVEIYFKMHTKKSGTSTIKMTNSPNPIKTNLTWISSTCPKE